MAKKKQPSRKSSGAAGMAVVQDVRHDHDELPHELPAEHAAAEAPVGQSPAAPTPRKPKKSESPAPDQLGLADIRKAAAFANAVGGLDKAIALLQILKVAKELH